MASPSHSPSSVAGAVLSSLEADQQAPVDHGSLLRPSDAAASGTNAAFNYIRSRSLHVPPSTFRSAPLAPSSPGWWKKTTSIISDRITQWTSPLSRARSRVSGSRYQPIPTSFHQALEYDRGTFKMSEILGPAAQFHGTEVEARKATGQDMAGGLQPTIKNTVPTALQKEDHVSATSNVLVHGKSLSNSVSSYDDEPTEEELRTLRRVADKLPKSAWLVAIIELCERFAYYGLSGPFQNYIQNPYHDPKLPGAIGLGQSGATGLGNFFQFWCYVTPILGAIIADQYLGKYRTILYFSLVYIVGLIILFLTSLPIAIEHGAALGGLIVAMIVIGLGTGGIKSNVSPLIAEQYQGTRPTIRLLKSGERVIVDPAVTIQKIYMYFYLCINVGSLSSIATTNLELHVGFWSAYLLPLLMFLVGFGVLIAGRKKYVIRPPRGSVIVNAFRAMWIGLVSRGNMDAAKPSYQAEYGRKYATPWNDLFVEEIKRALVACQVFVFFPIYWVVYSQMLNNFISQAGTMELHGIPNDIMQNIDPLTIIIFIPIFDRLIYPLLRRFGIRFKPITRITWGFFFGALAMAYAAIVQHIIYISPPCYNAPSAKSCEAGNHVHVALQTPAYLFIGISEIFASITGLEYAYTKAPPSMKSFVMSLFLLTTAFGSALGIALSPTAKDPKLVWMYTGLTIAALLAGCAFWLIYHRYNATEDSMNGLANQEEHATPLEDLGTQHGVVAEGVKV